MHSPLALVQVGGSAQGALGVAKIKNSIDFSLLFLLNSIIVFSPFELAGCLSFLAVYFCCSIHLNKTSKCMIKVMYLEKLK